MLLTSGSEVIDSETLFTIVTTPVGIVLWVVNHSIITNFAEISKFSKFFVIIANNLVAWITSIVITTFTSVTKVSLHKCVYTIVTLVCSSVTGISKGFDTAFSTMGFLNWSIWVYLLRRGIGLNGLRGLVELLRLLFGTVHTEIFIVLFTSSSELSWDKLVFATVTNPVCSILTTVLH